MFALFKKNLKKISAKILKHLILKRKGFSTNMEVDIPMLDLSDSDDDEVSGFIPRGDEPMDADDQIGAVDELDAAVSLELSNLNLPIK